MTELPEPENRMPEAGQVPALTVWPPPPTNGPPIPAGAIPSVFLSVKGLARALVILLSLYAALAGLGLAEALAAKPSAAYQNVARIIASAQGFLLLGTGICFLVWTYRLSRNLRAFGVAGLRTGSGWAVAYFFIPILSLYRPYQVFREIWQASVPASGEQAGDAWRTIKVPALLGFWWAFYLLMNVLDALSAQSGGTADIDAADNAIGFVSALLALQVVRQWTAQQEKTARCLSLLP